MPWAARLRRARTAGGAPTRRRCHTRRRWAGPPSPRCRARSLPTSRAATAGKRGTAHTCETRSRPRARSAPRRGRAPRGVRARDPILSRAAPRAFPSGRRREPSRRATRRSTRLPRTARPRRGCAGRETSRGGTSPREGGGETARHAPSPRAPRETPERRRGRPRGGDPLRRGTPARRGADRPRKPRARRKANGGGPWGRAAGPARVSAPLATPSPGRRRRQARDLPRRTARAATSGAGARQPVAWGGPFADAIPAASPAHAGFVPENPQRPAVDRLDLLARVPDRRHPELSVLRERADEVKQDARLGIVAVVKGVDRDDLDEVLGQEPTKRLRLEVVRRAIELRQAPRRVKEAGSRIELPARQELEREVGMRRAAHAEVDLEGPRLPGGRRIVPRQQEVDREAAHDALRGENSADSQGLLVDVHAIRVGGRKEAAEKHLAVRAAQDLVVRGDRDDRPVGIAPELDARGHLARSLEEFLGDTAHPAELFTVLVPRLRGHRERDAREGGVDGLDEIARRLGVVEERVALAREAVVQFHDRASQARLSALELDERGLDVVVVELKRRKPGLRSAVVKLN